MAEKKRQIIYNGEILDYIHVISVKVNPTANVTREPIEDGTPIADNKVRNPVSISCSVFVDGKDWPKALSKLDTMYTDKLSAGSASIKTASGMYTNMVLVGMPHEENNSDKFEHYYFDIEFQQILRTKSAETVVAVQYATSSTTSSGNAIATPK